MYQPMNPSRQNNITFSVQKAQLTGRSIRSTHQIPVDMMKRLDKENSGIPFLITELKVVISHKDIQQCKKTLHSLSKKLCDVGPTVSNARYSFVLFGGPEVLLDLLWRTPIGTPTISSILSIMNESLTILRELCFSTPGVSEYLSNYTAFVVHLFSLMNYKIMFDNAVGLVEEILAVKEMFDITSIPNFGQLVLGFSTRQLAFFCRVLALVIFEPDYFTESSLQMLKSLELLQFKRKIRNQLNDTNNNIAKNHGVLVGEPDLLERLVKLVHVQNFPSRRWTEELCSEYANASDLLTLLMGFDDNENDWEEPILPLPPEEPGAETPPMSLKLLTLATHQVEILFVICILLSGSQKSFVQKRLGESGLLQKLNKCFDKISWTPSNPDQTSDKRHGPRCECNPESALKIQYLRLILNFVDVEDKSQKKEILQLTEGSQSIETSNGLQLLSKLIVILMKEPFDSNFRFGVASCIESFLRGLDGSYQLFVANSGLLNFLLDEILGEVAQDTGILQTSFDLLGEILKFNPEVFQLFDSLLNERKFKKFSNIITNRLVDSNMFLRSMVLSLEYFRERLGTHRPATPVDCSAWKITHFIEESRSLLLVDLCNSITMDEISQENICCLNTTLVFLVLERRMGKLNEAVKAIGESDSRLERPVHGNLKKLMWFWKEYYHAVDKDSQTLESSTKIPFVEWKATVSCCEEAIKCKDT